MDKRKIQEINIKLNNSIEDSSDLKNGATINYINNEWDFNGNFYPLPRISALTYQPGTERL